MFNSRKHYIGVLAIKQKEINIAKDIYEEYRREYFTCVEHAYRLARFTGEDKSEEMLKRSHELYAKYLKAYCRYLDMVADFEDLELKVGLKYYA